MIDVRRDGPTLLPRHERLLVLAMLCIMPWMTGCAQIKSFSVAPSTVCPGETVEINWTASDKVTLNASPPLAGEGDQREWDVQVIPRQSDRLLGGIARCDDARFVTTSFTIEQTAMSSRARVASIANRYDRGLIVSKDDIAVEIPSHGATDRFKTVPLVGTWVIRTPVAQNETCDTALDAVSGRLTINTVMSCGESVHGDP